MSTKGRTPGLAIAAFVLCNAASAQNLDNPASYIGAINNAQVQMNKTYMSYISAVAHSKRAKKVEKLRSQTLDAITNSRNQLTEIPIYKGDNSLRKSSIDYVQLCYKVFDEDYAHVVNMEEIAAQSFDEMQAYILLQEKTGEKLQSASDGMDKALTDFAAKYNVTLQDGKSELGDKMEKAGMLNHYHNQVYLLFFKCNWQDGKLTEAMNAQKLNDVEQSRNALISYANEGLLALDSLKAYDGDASLANACKQALTFYKTMAENEVPKVTDLLLKQEEFEKIKKVYDGKSGNDKTKEDVDNYNKAVAQMNAAVGTSNKAGQGMNEGRNQYINLWNNTEKSFMDAHMPYF